MCKDGRANRQRQRVVADQKDNTIDTIVAAGRNRASLKPRVQ